MNTTKTLITLGTAIASSRIARSLGRMDAEHMLHRVGYERRGSHVWQQVVFFGLGALAGAGAALLLAPASGRETRERIGGEVDRLAEMANKKLHEIKEQAPSLSLRSSESEKRYAHEG